MLQHFQPSVQQTSFSFLSSCPFLPYSWYNSYWFFCCCWIRSTSSRKCFAISLSANESQLSRFQNSLLQYKLVFQSLSSFQSLTSISVVTPNNNNNNNNRLTALYPGLPTWAGNRKVKPIWTLLKQETVSGSGISTSPHTDNHASTLPLSFVQVRCPSCHPTNSIKALNKTQNTLH